MFQRITYENVCLARSLAAHIMYMLVSYVPIWH